MVDVPMLGLQYYSPVNRARGLKFGVFYDYYRLSGNRGEALIEPSFAKLVGRPGKFRANLTDVDGSGFHAGVSCSYVFLRKNGANFQIGVTLETLVVRKFQLRFDSIDLPENFSGAVDYAGTYKAVTPTLSYEAAPDDFRQGWNGRLKVSFSVPLPRVGFKGRISGPDLELSGDTDKIGKGTHIPDMYISIGYSMEQVSSGFRFDVGYLLYSYIVEPLAHTDIESPLFMGFSKSF